MFLFPGKFDKFIKIEQTDKIAIQKFAEELKSMSIFEELNQNIHDCLTVQKTIITNLLL